VRHGLKRRDGWLLVAAMLFLAGMIWETLAGR
jgi:hypothetical protein